MLLEPVLAVEALLTEGALEPVGRRVEAFVSATRACLREALAAIATRVRQSVATAIQHVVDPLCVILLRWLERVSEQLVIALTDWGSGQLVL